MKHVQLLSTGVLLLLLGIAAPISAQERHEEEAQAPKHEDQAKPAKEAKPEKQAKPVKQQQAKGQEKQQKEQQQQAKGQEKQQKEQQQQAKGQEKQQKEQQQQAKGEQKQQKEQQKQAADREKQGRANSPQAMSRQEGGSVSSQRPQRSSQDEARQRSEPALRLSTRGQGRIPDAHFRSHFGRGHRFSIGSPRMVNGYSRFQYGGYWFGFVEPWPEGWYYTDEVYIDYVDGGYYMFNPYYPGVRVAISVVF
jgi:hypothetical protein